jgi:PAS domain S-box-containing protein
VLQVSIRNSTFSGDQTGGRDCFLLWPDGFGEVSGTCLFQQKAGDDRLSGHEVTETGTTRVSRFHSIFDSVYCALVRIRDRDELFGEMCRAIGRSALFRRAWVGLIDPATMVLRQVASTDDGVSNFEQLRLSAEESTGERDQEARAIMAGKCYFSNDIETDPRCISWRLQALQQGFRSCAFVPLKLGDRVIGVFKLYSGEVGLFGDHEIKTLESLATAISCALTVIKHEEHRRRAEQELRESEGRYRRIVENMIGLVCQLDAERIFQFASPTCKSVLGYDPEQLLGKPFLSFAHAEDANAAESLFRSVEKSRSTGRAELRFRRAGGQYVWLEMATDPIFDESDRLFGFMCASRNIGERKEAEEKVKGTLATWRSSSESDRRPSER